MQRKLLLAEDSVTMQKVFELAFEKSDISVVAVDDGDQAVSMAEKISPDLVIADVTLPGKDGFEVAAALAAQESTKKTPVLILSSAFSSLDDVKLKESGAKGFLLKPFEISDLMEKVGGFMAKEEAPEVKSAPAEPSAPTGQRWDLSGLSQAPEKIEKIEKVEKVDLDEFDVLADDVDAPAASSETAAFLPPEEKTTRKPDLSAADDLLTMEEVVPTGKDLFLDEVDEIDDMEEIEGSAGAAPVTGESSFAAQEGGMLGDSSTLFLTDAPFDPTTFDPVTESLEDILEEPSLEIPEVFPAETPSRASEDVPREVWLETSEKPREEAPKEAPKEVAPIEVPKEVAPPEVPKEVAPIEAPKEVAAPEPPKEVAPIETPKEVAPIEIPKEVAPPEAPKAAPKETAEEFLPAELKERFAARADAIVREAAKETLEKAMSDMKERLTVKADAIVREVTKDALEKAMSDMKERLTAEFSAKIRESVEAVAWEVIPSAAEALIREEIARIRAGKTTS